MDVKGAKALSERLAEAARNVDPPPYRVRCQTSRLVACADARVAYTRNPSRGSDVSERLLTAAKLLDLYRSDPGLGAEARSRRPG